MDWADEHYVKLFTRDTVTWKLWPWEAKCLLPLLERKVDAAGFLPCGMHDPATAVASMVEIPVDVVRPGLAAMMETGTVELVGRQLLLVNFVAAQESRKTDKAKARDYRERKKAHARSEAAAKGPEPINPTVTARHPTSPHVTATNPPALLCSARPLLELPPAPRKKRADAVKTETPPDPRQTPLVAKFDEIYRTKRPGTRGFPWASRDFKTMQKLLQRRPSHEDALWPVELAAAFGRALEAKFPEFRSLEDFERDLPRHLGTGPPATNPSHRRDEVVERPEGLVDLA